VRTILAVAGISLVIVSASAFGRRAASPPAVVADSVVVPEAPAPVLDGTVSPDEWSTATRVPLAGGATVRLMHADGCLYLALQPKRFAVASACVDRGSEVTIHHTSGSLGTATYRRMPDGSYTGSGWQEWCCGDSTVTAQSLAERAGYFQRHGWTAPNGRLGVPEDMELKFAMPQGRLRLALTYVGGPDLQPGAQGPGSVWPADLADDCANRDLVTGDPPGRARFAPQRWVTVVAGPAAH
jgi:hypothetical protein